MYIRVGTHTMHALCNRLCGNTIMAHRPPLYARDAHAWGASASMFKGPAHAGAALTRKGVPATKARCRSGLRTAGSGVGRVASSALLVGSHSVAVSPAAAASSEPSALQAAASITSPAGCHRDALQLTLQSATGSCSAKALGPSLECHPLDQA